MSSQFLTFSLSVNGRPVAFRLSKICWGSSLACNPILTHTQAAPSPRSKSATSLRVTKRRAIRQAWATAPAPVSPPSRPRRYSSSSPSCSRSLRCLSGDFPGFVNRSLRIICAVQSPHCPSIPSSAAMQAQQDAHGRQPLLAVDDPKYLHHSRRTRFREGEERAAVMGRIGSGDSDCEEILDQSFDVSLAPAVAALPARHDVLDLTVQEFQELDVMGVQGFAFF